jgi:hypothetical protein
LIFTTKPVIALIHEKINLKTFLHTNVKDGHSELDVPKMARADLDVFFARRARIHTVDGAELGIVQALHTRLVRLLVLSHY